MEHYSLLLLSCLALTVSAWSVPFYPVYAVHRGPQRYIRHVRHIHPPPPGPLHRAPIVVRDSEEQWIRPNRPQEEQTRPKRDHDYDHDHDHDHKSTSGVTGPVHTFVKTDKNANYKWGVRHHVGSKYAS